MSGEPAAPVIDAGVGAVIDVRAAGKTYPNGTRALDPVSLTVRRREFVTLLGPSGCGKSTLLKMMAGLLAPSEGSVSTADGRMGFVFQDATLMPWATVRANVRLPLDLAKQDRSAADERVDQALKAVGLAGTAGHRPRELSGGMRMRASLARALVNEPELLLMDEPFGALDEITRNRLDADLIRLWEERHLTVVFVTHSIYEAAFLSTRVLVMSARPGRIVSELVIEEPQPRSESFRGSTRFAYNCRQLSALLAGAGGGA
jgi:NitT/TauT family transport system ATP-binding protein